MGEFVIKLPEFFSEISFDELLPEINSFLIRNDPAENSLVYDCEHAEYPTMLGILMLDRINTQVLAQGKTCLSRFKSKDINLFRFLLRAFGINKGLVDKTVAESLVIPLERCLSEKECMDVLNNKLDPFIKTKLAPSNTVMRALDWAIWEALANAGNHGYKIYDMTKNYPKPVIFGAVGTNEFISIGIADTGQGICSSFLNSGKPKYQGISNEKALTLAILNQESGGIEQSPGFGLFGCAEIARNADGKLTIISGDRVLTVTSNGETIKPIHSCVGTMLELKIPRNVKFDLSKIFSGDGPVLTDEMSKLLGNLLGDNNG